MCLAAVRLVRTAVSGAVRCKGLHGSADADYLDFSDVDSTHSISDSLVDVLRRRGPKGISYLDHKGRILLYIRAKYLDGQDTCSTTFYLDSEATGVVAFKDN